MRKILLIGLSVPVVYLLIALGLVVSQSPDTGTTETGTGLDFSAAIRADYSSLPKSETFAARDGTKLSYRTYPASGKTGVLLILVHGSAWHGMQFHGLARFLSLNGIAEVAVPDMRGHGASPKRRGDIDYIGQLEDDMADLITHLERQGSKRRVIVGGHSSGGGFVIRFAGGEHGKLAAGFVLMAPFLKHDAPTTRQNSGGWARPAIRRIIGLSMLNTVGITALNDLPIISFAMPKQVLDGPFGKTATTQYSYRLNTGFAPRPDYEADLERMTQPFLLLAGAKDEAFFADRYEAVLKSQTKSGTYMVMPELNHMGIVTDERAWKALGEWLKTKFGPAG